MNAERWLPVVGFEGYFEVSDHGRVRGLDRSFVRADGRPLYVKGRIRKPSLVRHGYLNIGIAKPGVPPRTYLVHQLVLAAFVGPCPEGLEVLHWDDNHGNNHLANLRYGTRSDNMRDAIRNGTSNLTVFAKRDACSSGHEYTPENTRLRHGGRHRVCRTCNRQYQIAYKQKLRQKRQAVA